VYFVQFQVFMDYASTVTRKLSVSLCVSCATWTYTRRKILVTFPGLGKLKKKVKRMLKYEMIDKIIDDIRFYSIEHFKTLKFVQQE
jgi:hypothetical protein